MPHLVTTITAYFPDMDTLKEEIVKTMPFSEDEKNILMADHEVTLDPSLTGAPVDDDTEIKVRIEED